MSVKLFFAPLLLAITASSAAAQYIPGLETPTDTADGFEQMIAAACPLAVMGEKLTGFTEDHPEETAIKVLKALPEALAPYVATSPKMRIMHIPTPSDDLYVVLDKDTKLCTVIAQTDPAPIKSGLIDPIANSGAWPTIDEPGAGFTHGFIYNFANVAKLEVRFALPETDKTPVIASVTPVPSVE